MNYWLYFKRLGESLCYTKVQGPGHTHRESEESAGHIFRLSRHTFLCVGEGGRGRGGGGAACDACPSPPPSLSLCKPLIFAVLQIYCSTVWTIFWGQEKNTSTFLKGQCAPIKMGQLWLRKVSPAFGCIILNHSINGYDFYTLYPERINVKLSSDTQCSLC